SVAAVLTAGKRELLGRLEGAVDRPLLEDDPAIRIGALLTEREEAYRLAGSPISTDGMPPGDVGSTLAARFLEACGDVSGPVAIDAGGALTTSVVVGPRAIERIPAAIPRGPDGEGRVVLVSDAAVAAGAGARVE